MKTGILSAIVMLLVATEVSAQQQLDFKPDVYKSQTLTLNDNSFKVRAYEHIVYVEHPADTTYQVMNIYIPEAYFEGGNVNGYTAKTAPIFFPNQVGGYMPAKPAGTVSGNMPPGAGSRPSTVLTALAKGYVVASAGARGRTYKNGKSPAAIVDLKAAVRYLKYNDKQMPGDADKIISNGTSAGGAMSALLGATGNNPDYEPYLKALGAASATDNIFAVSAYCPITNLDNADIAYEWQFNGINSYQSRGFGPGSSTAVKVLTEEQVRISDDLKAMFPAYLNGLKLKDEDGKLLTLDKEGNGSFKALVKSYVIASAQKALDKGIDLSVFSWIRIQNNKVTDLDFDAYVRYMERMKTPPAFDALDLSSPENQEFGTEEKDKQHFTKYSVVHSVVKGSRALDLPVKMLNPMRYVGSAHMEVSKHWRIRHGTKDKDTGLSISVMLTTLLQNKGYDVNLELPWDVPHSGDYDLDDLFNWIDGISK